MNARTAEFPDPESRPAHGQPQQLTPEEVEQTFEQLGLNNPRVRQYYLQLAQWEEPERPRMDWLGTHSGTNF